VQPRTPKRKIPEFVPWTIAAAAIVVAVVVAIANGGSSKTVSTKPPHAVQIDAFSLGNLPPLTLNRTMPNGVKLGFNTTGTMSVVIQRVVLQPGAAEPWHMHPGSGLATVRSGTIDDYEQVGTGCKLYVLGPGMSRFDGGSVAHTLVNNSKQPVVIWVTGFAPPGNPTALIPAKKPPNCAQAR
jgi:hypothetical protein